MCRGTCTFLFYRSDENSYRDHKEAPVRLQNILDVYFNNIIQTRGIIARAVL